MSQEEIDSKIANIENVNYIRIGEEMKVEIALLEYKGNKENFLNLVNKFNDSKL